MQLDIALGNTVFVIPSSNGGESLARMLPTLAIPTRLIVVLDQGSTDNTARVCKEAGVEFVPLGQPCSYAQACNVGAGLARERSAEFIYVARNDIAFATDVARQLLQEMLDDPGLAIAAPSQALIEKKGGAPRVAYRAFWSLDRLRFEYDFTPPPGDPRRIEADFCDLTCAIIRVSAIDRIGGFDEALGFVLDGADFCFRTRAVGFSVAYVPRAQIERRANSTFTGEMSAHQGLGGENDKRLFARNLLGYGVSYSDHGYQEATSWNIVDRNLRPYLRRFGLINSSRPKLEFSHPGALPRDYLYTVWETTHLPQKWLKFGHFYKCVFTPSRWNQEIFEQAGYSDVRYVPLGVETDVFNPWGPVQRPFAGKTFLWFAWNQRRKALDVMLAAWAEFRRSHPDARLIVMGVGALGALGGRQRSTRRWSNFIIADDPEAQISVWETLTPLTDAALATIYRGVDFVVSNARSEGFGFVVAEALACGAVPIFSGYGATAEFAYEGALMLRGAPARADYSDKGFGDVGDWWEPDTSHLVSLMREAHAMDAETRRNLAQRGMLLARNKFTWRNTCFALREALVALQEQKKVEYRPERISAIRDVAVGANRAANEIVDLLRRRNRRFKKSYKRWRERRAAKVAASQFAQSAAATRLPIAPPPKRDGVLFIGYAEAALGIGEAFRNLLTALARASTPFAIYPFNVNVETRRIGPFLQDRYDREGRYDVNVAYMATDQLPLALQELGPQRTAGSYNILRTYWELPRAPAAWTPLLQSVQELWAPSAFVADAFRDIFKGRVAIMPPCVTVERQTHYERPHFGMNEGRFYYLFSFDYFSGAARKNPLGVLSAFVAAFPDRQENVGLVMKSTGPTKLARNIAAQIKAAARKDARIVVIESSMNRDEVLSLIEQSDCYVSLHRSEGFGLGMAEALAFGKPVIGTDFSGATDFLSSETGYPVPFTLRKLAPGEYRGGEGQSWAEPDPNAAVEIMRQVFLSRVENARRGAAGKALVESRYGYDNVARVVTERLQEIQGERTRTTVAVNEA